MIEILTWISLFSGGILILMLLLSIVGGLDLDLDVDIGSSDVDTGSTDGGVDAGGLGLVKGLLTFISVASWMIKVVLVSNQHPMVAISIGLISGLLAFILLNYFLKMLLQNDENVNWSVDDAVFQEGEVYLKIPGQEESGIIQVIINGAMRELRAKSLNKEEIKTGETIVVTDVEGDYVLVEKASA